MQSNYGRYDSGAASSAMNGGQQQYFLSVDGASRTIRKDSRTTQYQFDDEFTIPVPAGGTQSSAALLRKESHASIASFQSAAAPLKHLARLDTLKQQQVNEMLTQKLLQTKRDIKEMAGLTRKLLGKRAISLQHMLLHENDGLDIQSEMDLDMEEQEEQQREMLRKKAADDKRALLENNDIFLNNSLQQLLPKKRTQSKHQKLMMGEQEGRGGGGRRQSNSENLSDETQTDLKHKQEEQHALNQLIQTMSQKEQEKKRGITESNLKEVFSRTRGLIERLWEEMHINPQIRYEFSRHYFYPETKMNYMFVFREIGRLCRMRGIHHRVLANVEMRETYIRRLKEIGMSATVTGVRLLDDPLIVNEVPVLVASLRKVSVDLVEEIVKWRQEIPKKQEFLWDDKGNYILSMQTDLDFLKLSEICSLFDFPVVGNPLLLPMHLRLNAGVVAQAVAAANGSSSDLNNSSAPKPEITEEELEDMDKLYRKRDEEEDDFGRTKRKPTSRHTTKLPHINKKNQDVYASRNKSADEKPFKTWREIRREDEKRAYLLNLRDDQFVHRSLEKLAKDLRVWRDLQDRRETDKLRDQMRFRRTSTANSVVRDMDSGDGNKLDAASRGQSALQGIFLKDYPPHYFACLPPPELFEKVKQTERIIFQEHHYKDYLRRIEMAERAVVKIQCAYRTYLARKYMKELRTDLLLRQYNKDRLTQKQKAEESKKKILMAKKSLASSDIIESYSLSVDASIEESLNSQSSSKHLNGRYSINVA